MLFFENDYGEGAHPAVLKHLAETNMEQPPAAISLIRSKYSSFGSPKVVGAKIILFFSRIPP